MSLLQLFTKYFPNKVFLAIFLGSISGLAYALLIPVLMTALTPALDRLPLKDSDAYLVWGIEVANPGFAALFLFLCILILITRTTSQVLLARISMSVSSNLRQSLYKQISNTSIPDLEKTSSGRVIQIMTADVQNIIFGAGIIPDVLVQLSTLVGLLCFLCYLNTSAFIFVFCTILFGVITFQLPIFIGAKYFEKSRHHMDLLQEGFSGLVDGAKELKLNRKKHKHFMEHNLLEQERQIVKFEKRAFTIVRIARNYGDLICFFAMGFICFVYINYHAITLAELTGVLMILLYITAPIAFILNILPDLARANISLSRVQCLFEELPPEVISHDLQSVPAWKTMHLKSICYHYPNEVGGTSAFGVGPIDASINRGEITFIVGGNGSGKSTLLKVVSLHYPTTSGEISFDNLTVTASNINSCREQIACIYSDYYLFKQLHIEHAYTEKLQSQIDYYLDILELKEKVQFHNGYFSTLKLSDGQRRRLALLVAFLDNKELYVFDEWAADQDPHFKEIFYLEILPNLKLQGKSVVAISHDDRYFHVADKVLVMEYGKLIQTKTTQKITLETSPFATT